MPEAFKKLFRNAKKVMNANKNRKIREKSRARESDGKMKTEEEESVDIEDIKQVDLPGVVCR